jgi:hypothetical protein
MERKNDSTILLLVAAGLGIYWYINNKKKPTDNISTQPVKEQPVSQAPTESFSVVENTTVKATGTTNNIEYTPVTEMFNSTMVTNYVDKTPMNATYNMNVADIE